MRLPDDPKDYYVHNPTPVTLTHLAELYKGKPSCSYANFKRRSRGENWKKQRDSALGKYSQVVTEHVAKEVAQIIIKSIEELDNDHLNEVRYFKKLILEKIENETEIKTDANGNEKRVLKISASDLARLIDAYSKLQRDERLYSGLEPEKIYFKGQGDSKFIEDHFGDLREIEIIPVEALENEPSE